MLVKCSWCQNTFNTDRYGRQFCPRCGAELEVPIPGGAGASEPVTVQPGEGQGPQPQAQPQPAQQPQQPQPPSWGRPPAGGPPGGGWGGLPPGGPGQPPPAGGPPPGAAPAGPPPEWRWDVGGEGPQDESAPWERRHELGFFPALIETWRQACLEPHRFFARLKTEDLTSAFFYAWIMGCVGGVVGSITSLPFTAMIGERPGAASLVGNLFAVPLGAALSIWISAALVHLGCLIFGSSRNGFEATFRAVAYAQGPMVLNFIPVIGWLAGLVWTTTLTVIGVTHLQRTTSGRALAAIVLPGLIFLGTCGCLFFAVMALFFGGIGAMLHGGGMP